MTSVPGADYQDEEQSSGSLGNIPLIIWQRRWLVIIPAVLIAIGATVAAFVIPRTYVSKAVLLVESQDLPGQTANGPSTETIDRRIAKIREQILSRPDLVDLIQQHNLYNASARAEPLSVTVDRMRKATDISAVDADITAGAPGKPGAGSIAFALTFEYPQAPEAQLVAQTFVNRLLTLDASESRGKAEENVHFLEDQQAKLQTQVSEIEGQINQVTGRNGAALANSGGLGMITIGGGDYDSQIANLNRENAQLRAQGGGAAVGRDPAVVAAEAQLAAARARFSDDHPDVKLAENQLAAAKANASSFQSHTVNPGNQGQIASNNQAIASLMSARAAAQGRAATAAAAQARGPVVAQQVAQLTAKADQVRGDYAKVSSQLLNAQSIAKLTDEQRGERLTLIEPPVTPDTPTKPNRPLLIAGGVFGGLFAGLALAFLIEMIYRPIRSVGALTKIVGAPPIGVVPTLSRKPVRRRRRNKQA